MSDEIFALLNPLLQALIGIAVMIITAYARKYLKEKHKIMIDDNNLREFNETVVNAIYRVEERGARYIADGIAQKTKNWKHQDAVVEVLKKFPDMDKDFISEAIKDMLGKHINIGATAKEPKEE